MPDVVSFKVIHNYSRRRVVSDDVRRVAQRVADAAAANTPRRTGRLAGAWRVERGRDPGTFLIVNETEYAVDVEYGTSRMSASAPLGRAMAATGMSRWTSSYGTARR